MDIGVEDIRVWHKDRGWDDIGYHYVIRRDGTVEPGRDEDAQGAHVRGWNEFSIGICLVGGSMGVVDYTRCQWNSLKSLVYRLKMKYPKASVLGHCDYDPGKTCPNFPVALWWNEALWVEYDYKPPTPEAA
jgi:N-acetylmuramoyl-L-alanine amidase